jgi:1,4-dihydroxy-2-naphthoate octaprenyltransferase
MATWNQWVQGARPRTLPAAIAPVAAGCGAAVWDMGFDAGVVLPRTALALGVSLALQVGVNFANDYSDGIRGTDDDRVGPFRLTGSGAARPGTVKRAAFGCFGVGAVCGIVLVALAGIWWALVVGAAAIAAAWFYTGGKKPYGYMGLGELFVFVFFGLVATGGTVYAITGRVTWPALLTAIGIGLLAVTIMLANNLRDLPKDAEAGKITLPVRIGDRGTRWLYLACVVVPFVLVAVIAAAHWPVLLTLLAVLLVIRPIRLVMSGATGKDLIPVLSTTGKVELVFSLLLLIGFVI